MWSNYTTEEIMWLSCVIRDAVRDHNPPLWRDIRYCGMQEFAEALEREYGISLDGSITEVLDAIRSKVAG